ncbi:MAG: hypothetical protein AAB427_00175 [Chloroflexota bacterium]
MRSTFRPVFAIAFGNALGYAAFRVAGWLTPQWWQAAGSREGMGTVMLLTAITAISFAAPPVIIGALAARLAARYEPYVGLGAGLWAVSARQWWPPVPMLPPESWIVPMALIMLSGLLGGWMVGLRLREGTLPD